MPKTILIALAVLWSAIFTPAAAKPKPATPAARGAQPALAPVVRVAITTSAGVITVDLNAAKAPLTTANFLRYVDQKRFDGTSFYRAMKLDWGTPPNGLIQGGTQNNPKRILKPVAHEPTSLTGLHHDAGAISMARFAPDTATGDFSILVSDMRGLDADPANKDDPAGYAVFGKVVDGMGVVNAVFAAPTSPTRGEGFMKGQMLAAPVNIITARRVALSALPVAAPLVAKPVAPSPVDRIVKPAMILPPAAQPAPVL